MIKLFDYQIKDIEWLSKQRHALLGHEMGLGKTAILIRAAQKIKAERILVVCPAVAKYNWQKEFIKFAGITAEVAGDGSNLWNRKIVITSFEYAKKFAHKYNQYPRDLLIVDEAHYLKEPTSGRTKAVLGRKGLIHNCDRSWFATGTPAPNHAGELWVMLYTFGLTKLSYDAFISRYCTTVRTGGHYSRVQITGTNTKHSHELKTIFGGQYLRRLKKDELDLPPITHNTFLIKGDNDSKILKQFPELRDKINNEFKELQNKLDFSNDINDEKLLRALSLMSPSIMSLRRYHGLKKVIPVADLVNSELESGEYEKIILFGIHKDVLQFLKRSIYTKFNPVLITGETPAGDRQQIVDRFQNDKHCRVFIGNIQAAGTAITLTAADQVGFVEQDWTPGNNAQAADRAHRIGQTKSVSVRHFSIAGSVDEKITATLTRKTIEISSFIK